MTEGAVVEMSELEARALERRRKLEALRGQGKTTADAADNTVATIIEDSKEVEFGENLNISMLAPKKADWDLKRGIQDKLDKLERRTNKAVAEIVRERIKADGKGNLATDVNAMASQMDN